MGGTWGIPGPMFLGLFCAGFAAALGYAMVVRRRVRQPRHLRSQPLDTPPLNAAELAFLAAGPVRVVEVAVSRLLETGRARVSRGGLLSSAAATGGDDPVEAEVMRRLGQAPWQVAEVMREVAGSGPVRRIGDRLVELGLLVRPADAAAARRRAVRWLYVLLGVGVLRLADGLRLGQPVAILTFLLLIALFLAIGLRRRRIGARTIAGDRVLAAVRRIGVNESNALLDPAIAVAGSAGAVALRGLGALPDETTRVALAAGAVALVAVTSWSYAGATGYTSHTVAAAGGPTASTGSCGGGGSSCSGGSSCGGGGGCGGGCGG